MDYNRIFTYIFKDEGWIKKVLIGGLLFFIPIVGIFFPIGYFLRHYRSMRDGNDVPLPEWSDFGDIFMVGLKQFVVNLIYAIPIFVIEIIMFAVSFIFISGAKNGGNISPIFGLFILIFYFLIFVYAFVFAFLMPGIIMKFTRNFSISEALKVGEILSIAKSNIKDFLILFLILIVAEIIASVGMILCMVGVVFTSFIAMGIYFRAVAAVERKLIDEGKL